MTTSYKVGKRSKPAFCLQGFRLNAERGRNLGKGKDLGKKKGVGSRFRRFDSRPLYLSLYLSATAADARAMFNQLSQGGTVVTGSTYPGTLVSLPGGGTVGLRTVMTNSPGTLATIDVNVPGVTAVTKIKFNP